MFEIPQNFLHEYIYGTTNQAHLYFGAHKMNLNGQWGVRFCVYAPHAKEVHVASSRNGWSTTSDPLRPIGEGVWANFFPHYEQWDDYKYVIDSEKGLLWKSDPFAFLSQKSPETASRVFELGGYQWNDGLWMRHRKIWDHLKEPISIYEVSLASWRKWNSTEYYSYDRLCDELVPYVKDLGYTHVELLPMTEYPFDGSWGYQQTGYFSITSRFGDPKGLMKLIDRFHQEGIGVFLDWVPSHYAKDSHGLSYFDGFALYESDYWHDAYNKQWDTMNFDFGKKHVRNFFFSNAQFLADVFHFDGLRVDAVAYMIHKFPEVYGGDVGVREEVVDFLKAINTQMGKIPGFLMMAEDSTAYDGVTRPIHLGGLGFHYKWNMGWMNDTLSYMGSTFEERVSLHSKLTFPMMYAFSEHFILPLSHDEVVHLKKSMISKLPGNLDAMVAGLRTLYLYQYTFPGKKLLFMGGEFAQFSEWREYTDLDWYLFDRPENLGIYRFMKSLNHFYRSNDALYQIETDWNGFQWLNADDWQNQVLSYQRRSETQTLSVLINFSPYEKVDYPIMKSQKNLQVAFSTIDADYQEVCPVDGMIYFTLAPLSGVVFKEEA